jgi:hypothetical protein
VRVTVKRAGLAVTAGAAIVVTAAGIAGASAAKPTSPPNECATGIYAGYCGTQVDSGTPALSISVDRFGQVVAASRPRPHSADWFWFSFEGGANDIAEFAPGGVASNLVMAQVGSRIVLQKGSGDTDQQWVFKCYTGCTSGPYAGTWTNIASGDVIAATTNGGRLRAVSLSGTPGSNETWAFQTP